VQTEARVAQRPIEDGEVVTACAQACPTDAIVFGRVDDPQSRVSRAHADKRAYAALEELGTRPRTRYLARVERGKKT
jgi:Fe-S-cluster-containing dehydrogenase component